MKRCNNCYRTLTAANNGYHERGDCLLYPNGTTVESLKNRIYELTNKNDKVMRDIDAAHELIANLIEKGNLGVEEEDMVDSYFEGLTK